jgi:hypothetical protein
MTGVILIVILPNPVTLIIRWVTATGAITIDQIIESKLLFKKSVSQYEKQDTNIADISPKSEKEF